MRRQLFYDPIALKQLTPRESTVLSAAKKNKPLDVIADDLDISNSLVARHLCNIVSKLDSSDKNLAQKILFSYHLEACRR